MPEGKAHFKFILFFLGGGYLAVINACNIPQFLWCKMQILFITVCDTSGTRIRKQLFYFISVITFQQISITFQFGRGTSDFLSISSPLTASQQQEPLLPSASTAISHPQAGYFCFNCREHVKSTAFLELSSSRVTVAVVAADCHYLSLTPIPRVVCRM